MIRKEAHVTQDDEFYVRYYVGHKGKFGHEFLEFEFRPDGRLRYANNSNYKNDVMILVIGAGFIGVECATEIEYFFHEGKLTIIDFLPKCLGPLPDNATEYCSEYIEIRENDNLSFAVWDVCGQDKIRPLRRHYYQGSNGLIHVVDSNDCNHTEDVREELMKMVNEDEMREAVLLVFTNKEYLHNKNNCGR